MIFSLKDGTIESHSSLADREAFQDPENAKPESVDAAPRILRRGRNGAFGDCPWADSGREGIDRMVAGQHAGKNAPRTSGRKFPPNPASPRRSRGHCAAAAHHRPPGA